MNMKPAFLFACAALAAAVSGAVPVDVDFRSNKWDRAQWIHVRHSEWNRGTPFVQTDEGIVNWSDAAWSDEEIYARHQIDVFSAMLLTNRFSGAAAFATSVSFDHRMAPAIVLADGVEKDAQGRDELRDFYEFVLYDEGLNVWLHRRPADGGKATVEKVAFLEARFEPKKDYSLFVSVTPKKTQAGAVHDIRIACAGHVLGFRDAHFPSAYRAGIIGAEGRCRFRNFRAGETANDVASPEHPWPRRLIRVNQVGYAAGAPKVAEVPVSVASKFKTFRVQYLGPSLVWRDVYEGTFPPPRGAFCYADFSCVTNPGDYRVVCGDSAPPAGNPFDRYGAACSAFFQIRDGVYAPLERTLFGFYTWQRCGHRKGWAGVCHQDRVPLVGTDRTIDMRGGYHQSCDLRCWADDTAHAVWFLYQWAEAADPEWDDGIVDEELRWGTEYFAKLVGPEGWAYDCQFEPIGWGPRNYYVSPAPMNAQVCVLHVLARAAKRFRTKDAAFARKCADKAETLMRSLETNPVFAKPYELPIPNIPPGSQPAAFYASSVRGNPNGDAAFASCALEIFEATDKAEYRAKALAYGEKVIRTFGDINYRGSCGTGSLMKMLPGRLFSLTGDVRYRDILRRQCQDFVRYAEESLQTNVSTLVPVVNGLVLLEGERVFGEPRYRVAAQRGIDWCLGVNCDEVSVVNGVGKHQQDLEVWGQFFPSTPWIPGAVTHVKHGEYNLPNAGGLMLVAQKLNR